MAPPRSVLERHSDTTSDGGLADRATQNSDAGDADLHRGKKSSRLSRQLQRSHGAALAGLYQLNQPGATRTDHRDLGHGEHTADEYRLCRSEIPPPGPPTTVSTSGRAPNLGPWVTSRMSGRNPARDSPSARCPRVVAYTSSPASRQTRATRSPRYPQPTTSLRTCPLFTLICRRVPQARS